ncbi:MAG: hypothetical protein FWG16_06100, partial [Micrococcales bacterium]|nr:hypothetical protein [Micrococcales bacterium]
MKSRRALPWIVVAGLTVSIAGVWVSPASAELQLFLEGDVIDTSVPPLQGVTVKVWEVPVREDEVECAGRSLPAELDPEGF